MRSSKKNGFQQNNLKMYPLYVNGEFLKIIQDKKKKTESSIWKTNKDSWNLTEIPEDCKQYMISKCWLQATETRIGLNLLLGMIKCRRSAFGYDQNPPVW